jgi:hypothetical protein
LLTFLPGAPGVIEFANRRRGRPPLQPEVAAGERTTLQPDVKGTAWNQRKIPRSLIDAR